MYIENIDILEEISKYMKTKEMILLSRTCKYYYATILYNVNIMRTHRFTLKKRNLNLKCLSKLPYNILNISLNENKKIQDNDFKYLKNIRTLNMNKCLQFSDNAFKYLKDIEYLFMQGCRQESITDNAFIHMNKLKSLWMSDCNQKTITDNIFKNLYNITELVINGCYQDTITNNAFIYMNKLQILSMIYCYQKYITTQIFNFLPNLELFYIYYRNYRLAPENNTFHHELHTYNWKPYYYL